MVVERSAAFTSGARTSDGVDAKGAVEAVGWTARIKSRGREDLRSVAKVGAQVAAASSAALGLCVQRDEDRGRAVELGRKKEDEVERGFAFPILRRSRRGELLASKLWWLAGRVGGRLSLRGEGEAVEV